MCYQLYVALNIFNSDETKNMIRFNLFIYYVKKKYYNRNKK